MKKVDDDRVRELYAIEKEAYNKYVRLRAGDHPRRVTEAMIAEARKDWITKLGALKNAGGTTEVLMRVLQPGRTTTRRRKR